MAAKPASTERCIAICSLEQANETIMIAQTASESRRPGRLVRVAAIAAIALAAAAQPLTAGFRPERPDAPSLVHKVIVGGEAENDPAIKRTVVQLFSKSETGDRSVKRCTGAQIAKGVILTAAHCLPDNGVVRFGYSGGKHVLEASSWVKHPDYYLERNGEKIEDIENVDNIENDIAVLFFKMKKSDEKHYFRLPSEDTLTSATGGPEMTLSGYGNTDTDPDNKAKRHKLRTVNALIEKEEGQRIAVSGYHGTCQGDSGGPMYVTSNGERFVLGVSSRSNCLDVSIYTRVAAYADWIVEQVRAHGYEIHDPVRLLDEGFKGRKSVDPGQVLPPGFPKPGSYSSRDECVSAWEARQLSEFGPACALRVGCQLQMEASMTLWKETCDSIH